MTFHPPINQTAQVTGSLNGMKYNLEFLSFNLFLQKYISSKARLFITSFYAIIKDSEINNRDKTIFAKNGSAIIRNSYKYCNGTDL